MIKNRNSSNSTVFWLELIIYFYSFTQDLIDDNPIEEDSDGENSDGSRRQKRKSRSDDELDDRLEDDDYDLLEENLGVKVQRKVNSFEWI